MAFDNITGTTSNEFIIGNKNSIDGYVYIKANFPSSTPTIRTNEANGKWEFSPDGQTYSYIGSGGWTPLIADTDFQTQALSAATIGMITDQSEIIQVGYPIRVLDGFGVEYNDTNNELSNYNLITGITSKILDNRGRLYFSTASMGSGTYQLNIYNRASRSIGSLVAYTGVYNSPNTYPLITTNNSGIGGYITITGNGVQPTLVDGDFEGSISAWSAVSCSESKVSGTRTGGSGSYVGQINYNGSGSGTLVQTILTVGQTYHVTGWARGDGTSIPDIEDISSILWTGTSSATWQYFDVTFYETGGAGFYLYGRTLSAGHFVQFDDITITNVTVGPAQATVYVDFYKWFGVQNCTSSLLSLVGPALNTTAGMIKEMWYGSPSRIIEVPLFIPGNYATTATTSLLSSFMNMYYGYQWIFPRARIIYIKAAANAVSPAPPTINVLIGTVPTSANGITLTLPQHYYIATDIIPTQNLLDIAGGSSVGRLEVSTTLGGISNSQITLDSDLSIYIALVLE